MAGRKVAKECRGSGGVDFVRVSETRPSSEATAGKPPTLLRDALELLIEVILPPFARRILEPLVVHGEALKQILA
jgi:hypothetical protein